MPTGGSWQLLIQWEGGTAVDATWEALPDFKERYPTFKLEDELFGQGGEVLWTPSLARHMGAEPRPKRPQQISCRPRLIQGRLNSRRSLL
jgi:hypothetical protein